MIINHTANNKRWTSYRDKNTCASDQTRNIKFSQKLASRNENQQPDKWDKSKHQNHNLQQETAKKLQRDNDTNNYLPT
ncbi:hypothetical protein TSUD_239630 [Trifolium subterraneum]|uniref:Uncharacterized protein n=1 Tax=Trifolium subterraneum TaxID=3900 RepID=A0A2Z6PD10_TRISU|nr:hypothetical protein TSUD_239630 [Trifolium subterraneum]